MAGTNGGPTWKALAVAAGAIILTLSGLAWRSLAGDAENALTLAQGNQTELARRKQNVDAVPELQRSVHRVEVNQAIIVQTLNGIAKKVGAPEARPIASPPPLPTISSQPPRHTPTP